MERAFGHKRYIFYDSLGALVSSGVLTRSVSQVFPGKGRSPFVYHINPESYVVKRLERTSVKVEGVFLSTLSSLCLNDLNTTSVQMGMKTYELTYGYRLLLALLLKHADVFGVIEGVSRQELARQARLSLNTVKFYIKDMEDKGLLLRQFRGTNVLSWLPKAKSIYQLNLIDMVDNDNLSSRYRWSMKAFGYRPFRSEDESMNSTLIELRLANAWKPVLKKILGEKDLSHPYVNSVVDALVTRSINNLKVRPETEEAQSFVAYMADNLDFLLGMLKLSEEDEKAFRKLVGGSLFEVPADIGKMQGILFGLSRLSYKRYTDVYHSMPRAYMELLRSGKVRSLRVSTLLRKKLVLRVQSDQAICDIPARLRVSMFFQDLQGALPLSKINLVGFEDQFGNDHQDILHNCNVIGLPLVDLESVNGLIYESRSNPVDPDR